mmetsp:Transcript_9577/g.29719  ORF Transcript_9577/g.29719 Transcript_9577/m.29719 type:complete len:219 (-) Transcript_9577:1191-1847(-)
MFERKASATAMANAAMSGGVFPPAAAPPASSTLRSSVTRASKIATGFEIHAVRSVTSAPHVAVSSLSISQPCANCSRCGFAGQRPQKAPGSPSSAAGLEAAAQGPSAAAPYSSAESCSRRTNRCLARKSLESIARAARLSTPGTSGSGRTAMKPDASLSEAKHMPTASHARPSKTGASSTRHVFARTPKVRSRLGNQARPLVPSQPPPCRASGKRADG